MVAPLPCQTFSQQELFTYTKTHVLPSKGYLKISIKTPSCTQKTTSITSLLELYRLPPKPNTFFGGSHFLKKTLATLLDRSTVPGGGGDLGQGSIGPVEVVWIFPGNGGIC